jgi:hypothetical protein
MGDGAALRLALELIVVPWRVRLVREQPLPEGVPLILRIASGDAEAEAAAAKAAGRPPEVVRQAATFFIEQILLAPGADSYRILGTAPTASTGELRTNMALLMKWLHPDAAQQGEQSVYAQRLTAAWNDLKSPERRAAYDSARMAPPGFTAPGRGSRSGRSRHGSSGHGKSGAPRRIRLPRLLAYFLLGRPRR